jgi:hypothetical protein
MAIEGQVKKRMSKVAVRLGRVLGSLICFLLGIKKREKEVDNLSA